MSEGRGESRAESGGHEAAIVAAIRDGAYVLDADRTRVAVNDRLREVSEFDEEVLYGTHPEAVVEAGYWDPDEAARYRAAVERVLAGESADERVQLTTTLGDGRTVTTETRLTPYRPAGVETIATDVGGEDGEGGESDDPPIEGVVGVIRDVTERVEREQRLERLADFLSHDLRNPLAVAHGYTELAIETGSVDDLDRVTDALDRMDRLLSDVLVTMRDPDQIDRSSTDVAAIARDCWGAGDFDEGTLVVDSSTLHVDESLIARGLTNLFANAVEHGDDPTVRVRVDGTDLHVSDDGPGVPPERRGSIRKFGVSDGGSTGVGLAIVERVATIHGGSVELGESSAGGLRVTLRDLEPTS